MSQAERDQFKYPNYDRDDWENTKIPSGTKLYRLDIMDKEGNYSGSYFVDEATLLDGDYVSISEYEDEDGIMHEVRHFDAEKFANDFQISPFIDSVDKLDADGNPILDDNGEPTKELHASYKNHISVFEVPEGVEINAETGTTDANYAYGHGGYKQYYIPKEEQGKLKNLPDEEELYKVENREIDPEAAVRMRHSGWEVSKTNKQYGTDPTDVDEYDGLSEEDIADLEESKAEFQKLQQIEKDDGQETDTKRIIDR